MKKILITILLLLSAKLLAPDIPGQWLGRIEPINWYDPLINAIHQVETSGDDEAFNPEEEARGPLQIRPIRLNDYVKRTGKDYHSWDCYDWNISREIFLFYAQGKTYERASRDWNGKWSLTEGYWKRVKYYL